MTRTWQNNADELRQMDEGEGWAFARLVACSVAEVQHGGSKVRANLAEGKTDATTFATRSGTTHQRVIRFLDAWNKAAEQSIVERSAHLGPDDVETPYPTAKEHSWLKANGALRFGDASKAGGRPRDSKAEDAATIVDRRGAKAVVEAMSPQQRRDVAEAVLADPEVAAHVVEHKPSRKAIDKAHLDKEVETTKKARATRSDTANAIQAEREWMDTYAHGDNAAHEATRFARELPNHTPLSEGQRERVEYITERLSNALEFIRSALAGQGTDAELLAILEKGA